MDSFYKNQFNAVAWSSPVASIDQIDYSFFGFDIISKRRLKIIIAFKSHLNEKTLLKVKQLQLDL